MNNMDLEERFTQSTKKEIQGSFVGITVMSIVSSFVAIIQNTTFWYLTYLTISILAAGSMLLCRSFVKKHIPDI